MATPDTSASPGGSGSFPGSPQIEDFGATTLLFTDSFDDVESGWGTGSTPGGVVTYADSALQLDAATSGGWVWSYRPLEAPMNVARVEASFTPSAAGYQGLVCASDDSTLYGAVANDEGRWAFITLTGVQIELLTTQQDPAWAIQPQVATRMALDCAGTAAGVFRMQLSLPDLGIAVRHEMGATGPASFDRVGVYGEASVDGYSLRVDDASAFGGTGAPP